MILFSIACNLRIIGDISSPSYLEGDVSYVRLEGDVKKDAYVWPPYKFSAPSINGYSAETFGASEVKGLFGGTTSSYQFGLSEVSERAIGELQTVALCKILDLYSELISSNPKEVYIIIFGPTLPKIVGRYASLRPLGDINISWICPRPLPNWFVPGMNEFLLNPSVGIRIGMKGDFEEWEEESLVMSFEYEQRDDEDNSKKYWIQSLNIYGTRIISDVITGVDSFLKSLTWKYHQISNTLLPSGIINAIQLITER